MREHHSREIPLHRRFFSNCYDSKGGAGSSNLAGAAGDISVTISGPTNISGTTSTATLRGSRGTFSRSESGGAREDYPRSDDFGCTASTEPQHRMRRIGLFEGFDFLRREPKRKRRYGIREVMRLGGADDRSGNAGFG